MRRTDQMQNLFDRIAPSYDRVTRIISMGRDNFWRRRSIEHLQESIAQPAHILDACCGTGEYTFGLARAFPNAAIVGMDFAPAMLAAARKKQESRPKPERRAAFEQGDLNSLPYEDGRFDLVTVAFGLRNSIDYEQSVFELVRVLAPGDHRQVFQEAWRVLKPGGRLLIWDVCIPPRNGRQEAAFIVPLTVKFPDGTLLKTGYGVEWKDREQNMAGLSALAVASGFQCDRTKQSGEVFEMVLFKGE